MSDMQCPYCGADQEVCHDDGFGYDEYMRHEHQCSACEKYFVFTTTIHITYDSYAADCLNGEPHELKLSKAYPLGFSKMHCANCYYERRASVDEIEQHVKPSN